MPKTQPEMSYTLLRNYTEKFQWIDPVAKSPSKGFNPPEGATNVERVPFFINYVTGSGKTEKGIVVCIRVMPEKLQRKIMFVDSGEIRIVYDYLIREVDGVKFITH